MRYPWESWRSPQGWAGRGVTREGARRADDYRSARRVRRAYDAKDTKTLGDLEGSGDSIPNLPGSAPSLAPHHTPLVTEECEGQVTVTCPPDPLYGRTSKLAGLARLLGRVRHGQVEVLPGRIGFGPVCCTDRSEEPRPEPTILTPSAIEELVAALQAIPLKLCAPASRLSFLLHASVRRHRSAPQPGGASDHQERLEPSSRQPAMMDVINPTEGDRIGSIPHHSEYWNQGRKKHPFKAATTG
jgi:hypothetical protein